MEQDVLGVATVSDPKYAMDYNDEDNADENNMGSRTNSDAK